MGCGPGGICDKEWKRHPLATSDITEATRVSSGRVSEAHTDSSAGRRSADKKERRERNRAIMTGYITDKDDLFDEDA